MSNFFFCHNVFKVVCSKLVYVEKVKAMVTCTMNKNRNCWSCTVKKKILWFVVSNFSVVIEGQLMAADTVQLARKTSLSTGKRPTTLRFPKWHGTCSCVFIDTWCNNIDGDNGDMKVLIIMMMIMILIIVIVMMMMMIIIVIQWWWWLWW